MHLYRILAPVLGGHGKDSAQPDTDAEGTGIRNGGKSAGGKPWQDNKEASADELHGNPDRNGYPADPVVDIYRKLPQLHRHRRCGPDAVAGLDGSTGYRRDLVVPPQAAGARDHDKP